MKRLSENSDVFHSLLQEQSNTFRKKQVSIILSIYNGEKYLEEQLESILTQTYNNWVLYWRDDGSSDNSRSIITKFSEQYGQGKCFEIPFPAHQMGIPHSYLHLLASIPKTAFIAFSDQDDVWFPQKLTWAIEYLQKYPDNIPLIYCARQYLADSHLNIISKSTKLQRQPNIASSLTQNIATGHTIVINEKSRLLIEKYYPPHGTLHDWWAYLVTMTGGGKLLFDERCVNYYRQHNNNTIGAKPSFLNRAIMALKRGPNIFIIIFEENIEILLKYSEFIHPEAKLLLRDISNAKTFLSRLSVLKKWPNLRRQGSLETFVFRIWYLLAKRE